MTQKGTVKGEGVDENKDDASGVQERVIEGIHLCCT